MGGLASSRRGGGEGGRRRRRRPRDGDSTDLQGARSRAAAGRGCFDLTDDKQTLR